MHACEFRFSCYTGFRVPFHPKTTTPNMDLGRLTDGLTELKGVTATGKELGSGAYKRVFEVVYCGTYYAAKEIHAIFQDVHYTEMTLRRVRDQFLRECYLQSRCAHPNIVRFIGIYHPAPNNLIPTMVMELMDCSLPRFIEKDTVPLHSVLSILHDVSLGVWYLHGCNPPMHCDLSPNSILVNTKSMVAKITGAIERNNDPEETLPGLVDFMAPEVYMNLSYGLPMDVFSYGGVALYTVVGKWPMVSNKSIFDPKTRVRVALSEVERRQQYLDKMIGEAKVLRPLVEACLNDDPAVRPTIEVVSVKIKEVKKDYMDRHPETKVIFIHYMSTYS